MTTDAQAITRNPGPSARFELFWEWLMSELAPFPGRGAATLRMLVACLLIVTISMTLELPQAYLSAFFVFFMSKEDLVSTTMTGVALALALILGFGITIPAYLFSVDHPPLRLALMAIVFCGAMFISRVFALGPVAFGVGFVVLISQQFVDLYQGPEALVRGSLWSWVAMTFPIAVVLIVNRIILPERPVALLRREARLRVEFVIETLDRRLAGMSMDAATAFQSGFVDATRLLTLLKLSASGDPALKSRIGAYRELIGTLNRLVEAACILNALRPALDTGPDHARFARLRSALDVFRDSLEGDPSGFRMALPPQVSRRAEGGPVGVILDEMERHGEQISADLERLSTAPLAHAASDAPAPTRRLFVSDALSNPAYLHFSLKVTAAAMFCYILYTAIDWPGIHTCVITCAVIALGSTGATIHKASLRVSGALIGGGLAILATVFVVPHMESIGDLLLLILPVAALSGWIASGSERISYSGVQIAMAFFYGVLEGHLPSADVTHVRDRVVGILLGIAVMAVIFTYLWPERAQQQMRVALVKALRTSMALLQRFNATGPAASARLTEAERSVIFENLVLAQRMAQVSMFEPAAGGTGRIVGTDAELVAATQATALSSLQVVQLRAAHPQRPADVVSAYGELRTRIKWLRSLLDGLHRHSEAQANRWPFARK